MKNRIRYVLTISHGKDSQALFFRLLLEEGYPLDEVIYFHMKGAEFSAIEEVSYETERLCKERGIKYTRLEPAEGDFHYYATERMVEKNNGEHQCGYKWCGRVCRWGTSLKIQTLKKYYAENFGDSTVVEYVGIASDERHRINRQRNGNVIKLYPLVEWGMTEADCLSYCYSKGIYWEQDGYRLYDLLDRVSCKYCQNKNLNELRNIYHCLPSVWEELKALQSAIDIPFKDGKTIFDIERRFVEEDRQISIFEFSAP